MGLNCVKRYIEALENQDYWETLEDHLGEHNLKMHYNCKKCNKDMTIPYSKSYIIALYDHAISYNGDNGLDLELLKTISFDKICSLCKKKVGGVLNCELKFYSYNLGKVEIVPNSYHQVFIGTVYYCFDCKSSYCAKCVCPGFYVNKSHKKLKINRKVYLDLTIVCKIKV